MKLATPINGLCFLPQYAQEWICQPLTKNEQLSLLILVLIAFAAGICALIEAMEKRRGG